MGSGGECLLLRSCMAFTVIKDGTGMCLTVMTIIVPDTISDNAEMSAPMCEISDKFQSLYRFEMEDSYVDHSRFTYITVSHLENCAHKCNSNWQISF